MGIDREGWGVALVPGGIGAAAFAAYLLTGWNPAIGIASVAAVAAVYVLSFFRDPERTLPEDPGVAVSAADGVVIDAGPVACGLPGGADALRIAVFMNVFNVHVNRAPVAGRVIAVHHRPGRKLAADKPRAALENEHAEIDMDTPGGPVRVRQIAGLVARRVVTRVAPGDSLDRGGRIGLIRFGSRVDVLLPAGCTPLVRIGDRVRAGETAIARL